MHRKVAHGSWRGMDRGWAWAVNRHGGVFAGIGLLLGAMTRAGILPLLGPLAGALIVGTCAGIRAAGSCIPCRMVVPLISAIKSARRRPV